MKMPPLQTNNSDVMLVEPNIKRDAALGINWLAGDLGRETLALMGVTAEHNKPGTLEVEQTRIKDFIENPKHLNWMISYKNQVVGAIWVDLEPTDQLPAPSPHIMIGDPSVRGKGIGTAAMASVVGFLQKKDHKIIYSRHLSGNTSAAALLHDMGFAPYQKPYEDEDGLVWQNEILRFD